MLTGPMKESNQSENALQEVSTDIFSIVLKYIYTGDSNFITSKNTVDVLDTASRFQLENLMIDAVEWIRTEISAIDCFIFVHKYNVGAVRDDTKKQILHGFFNYKKVAVQKLGLEQVFELVSSNEMIIRSERDFVGVALRWLRGTDDRSRH